MTKWDKFRTRLMSGNADANIDFADLCGFLERLGFDHRIQGDHHIFTRDGVNEIINLQPLPDGRAKVYQVRQVRDIIRRYGL
ncbi:MAG: type II toxin-antitoxin system HicA family toxin [Armatimonadota bacterium]